MDVSKIKVYYGWKDSIPPIYAEEFQPIGTLPLPAGKWVVFAKLWFGRNPALLPGPVHVVARLEMGQNFDERIDGMKRLTPDSTWWHRVPPQRDHALSVARRRGSTKDHIGIDLHKKDSQMCILVGKR